MIQFNLLPDVKLEYIKARRLKRTVILISSMVSAAAVALMLVFFVSVEVVQTHHMSNVDKDIQTSEKQLKAKPDLAKILTIQNQLNSLTALHQDKPVASRVFAYVQQLAPQQAELTSLTVNFDEQTMTIAGNAGKLADVNTFVDTLKFTMYNIEGESSNQSTNAFSEVVLSQFGVSVLNTADKSKPATFNITLKYDPAIFDSSKTVALVVPNKVTTRSETEKPTTIFQPSTTTSDGGDN